jgi:hypothetical protein
MHYLKPACKEWGRGGPSPKSKGYFFGGGGGGGLGILGTEFILGSGDDGGGGGGGGGGFGLLILDSLLEVQRKSGLRLV